jgi:hypothetical protein
MDDEVHLNLSVGNSRDRGLVQDRNGYEERGRQPETQTAHVDDVWPKHASSLPALKEILILALKRK